MTIREVEEVLYSYRKANKVYEYKLLSLYKLRHEMQGLRGSNYEQIRVQGGEKGSTLEKLLDKAIDLENKVQECLIAKTTAYDNAMRLINLLENRDNLWDVLGEFFLLDKSVSQIAKKYYYSKQTCYNKICQSKRAIAKITQAKGLTKEDFT